MLRNVITRTVYKPQWRAQMHMRVYSTQQPQDPLVETLQELRKEAMQNSGTQESAMGSKVLSSHTIHHNINRVESSTHEKEQ